MMETGLMLIVAITAICFLILYFVTNTVKDEKHTALKILGILLVVGLLPLIPKAAIDNEDRCAVVPENETVNASANTTHIDYIYFCSENPNTTSRTFYIAVLYISRLIMLYIFVFYIIVLFKYLKKTIPAFMKK